MSSLLGSEIPSTLPGARRRAPRQVGTTLSVAVGNSSHQASMACTGTIAYAFGSPAARRSAVRRASNVPSSSGPSESECAKIHTASPSAMRAARIALLARSAQVRTAAPRLPRWSVGGSRSSLTSPRSRSGHSPRMSSFSAAVSFRLSPKTIIEVKSVFPSLLRKTRAPQGGGHFLLLPQSRCRCLRQELQTHRCQGHDRR